jgi:hypothetical protein
MRMADHPHGDCTIVSLASAEATRLKWEAPATGSSDPAARCW